MPARIERQCAAASSLVDERSACGAPTELSNDALHYLLRLGDRLPVKPLPQFSLEGALSACLGVICATIGAGLGQLDAARLELQATMPSELLEVVGVVSDP